MALMLIVHSSDDSLFFDVFWGCIIVSAIYCYYVDLFCPMAKC